MTGGEGGDCDGKNGFYVIRYLWGLCWYGCGAEVYCGWV